MIAMIPPCTKLEAKKQTIDSIVESDKDFQREKNDFFNMRMYVRIAVQRQVTRDSHAYTVLPYGSVASICDVESSQLSGGTVSIPTR